MIGEYDMDGNFENFIGKRVIVFYRSLGWVLSIEGLLEEGGSDEVVVRRGRGSDSTHIPVRRITGIIPASRGVKEMEEAM